MLDAIDITPTARKLAADFYLTPRQAQRALDILARTKTQAQRMAWLKVLCNRLKKGGKR